LVVINLKYMNETKKLIINKIRSLRDKAYKKTREAERLSAEALKLESQLTKLNE